MKLVDLIQFMLENGSIPTELGCNVLVLTPKGNVDTWGIGLLEFIWKVVEAVIDTQIKISVQYHDAFHRFHAGRKTETLIMELKLAQELVSVYQGPLLLVLLDLSKAYDNIDRRILLQTLARYGTGPKLRVLLAEFWLPQEVVTRQNVFHGPQFQATRGTTQGVISSPTLFNVEM